MRVLIAFEYSGITSKAFRDRGHISYSLDIVDARHSNGFHIKEDFFNFIEYGSYDSFDFMLAHIPCTYLSSVGAKHYSKRDPKLLNDSINLYKYTMSIDIPKISIENPVGLLSTYVRKPDQYIQPYEYGDPYTKKTGLWLKNLNKLKPTNIIEPIGSYMLLAKKKDRSNSFPGIANAMASQWG